MAVEAVVIPSAPPEVGGDILTAISRVGKPRVFVPTDKITIGVGETLTIDGTIAVNGVMTGGNNFVEAIIDGGHSDSTYYETFDLDGGGA